MPTALDRLERNAEMAKISDVPVGTIRSRAAGAKEDLLDAPQDRQHGTG
jgi:DNA-directed RNA polymerase specialized sigma24 family protein